MCEVFQGAATRRFVMVLAAGGVLGLVAWGCGGRSVSAIHDGAMRDGSVTDGGLDAQVSDAQVSDAQLSDAHLGDAGPDPCSTLTLAQCRLRADCAVDTCWVCTCEPEFEGCRDASDPPYDCPDLGCMQPLCCQSQAECNAPGGVYAAPGTPNACGMCDPFPGDCAADGDCAAGSICEPVPCSCNGALRCVPGCAQPTDCGPGATCAAGDHPRCEPVACDAQNPCPPDFDCLAGACARRLCTSDLECDHYCVMGGCYPGYGECRMPPPP